MSCDVGEVTERLENEQSFSYITGPSLTSLGEPPMVCLVVVNGYSTYTEYIELTCTVFMLFIHKLHFYLQNFCSD